MCSLSQMLCSVFFQYYIPTFFSFYLNQFIGPKTSGPYKSRNRARGGKVRRKEGEGGVLRERVARRQRVVGEWDSVTLVCLMSMCTVYSVYALVAAAVRCCRWTR